MNKKLIEVTRKKFFEMLNADGRDIMPFPERKCEYWKFNKNQNELWGYTDQGWSIDRSRVERFYIYE